ncbi:hypothetical protein T439DRAFT_325515 [Meredithblackwellia eburnea MCA 4105]
MAATTTTTTTTSWKLVKLSLSKHIQNQQSNLNWTHYSAAPAQSLNLELNLETTITSNAQSRIFNKMLLSFYYSTSSINQQQVLIAQTDLATIPSTSESENQIPAKAIFKQDTVGLRFRVSESASNESSNNHQIQFQRYQCKFQSETDATLFLKAVEHFCPSFQSNSNPPPPHPKASFPKSESESKSSSSPSLASSSSFSSSQTVRPPLATPTPVSRTGGPYPTSSQPINLPLSTPLHQPAATTNTNTTTSFSSLATPTPTPPIPSSSNSIVGNRTTTMTNSFARLFPHLAASRSVTCTRDDEGREGEQVKKDVSKELSELSEEELREVVRSVLEDEGFENLVHRVRDLVLL